MQCRIDHHHLGGNVVLGFIHQTEWKHANLIFGEHGLGLVPGGLKYKASGKTARAEAMGQSFYSGDHHLEIEGMKKCELSIDM